MPKTVKKTKRSKILLLATIGAILIASICGYIWYNYMYNPVLYKLNEKNRTELHEIMSDLCLVRVAVTSGYNTREKYLCRCFADELTKKTYNQLIRKKTFHKEEELIWKECTESVRYSNMSSADLKDLFTKQCFGLAASNGKFCTCYGHNMAYIIKNNYTYESEIVSDFQVISKLAFELCKSNKRL